MIRRLSDRFWNYLTDRIEARMHLRPSKDNAFDLGSSDYAWRRVYVGPGSASAPSISPSGDSDTGLYQSAADNLDFATGGVRRLNVSSAGVGVDKAVVFPATQNPSTDAHALDDYEEGTWTPNVGGTATYTRQIGRYVKIGKWVYVAGHLKIDAIGTGAAGVIWALPFLSETVSSFTWTGSVGYFESLALNVNTLSCYVGSNASSIRLVGTTTESGMTTDGIAVLQDGSGIYFSVMYETTQ